MIRRAGRLLSRLGPAVLALAVLAPAGAPALADESAGPSELVHVPSDELDVLLRADRKGIVLRYAEYERLMKAAGTRAAALAAQPPVDGALVSASGRLDLTPERAGTLRMTYGVRVLAEGPRSVEFPLRNLAVEDLVVQDEDGTPDGRYEEWQGRPRLRFDTPGTRTVTFTGSASFSRKEEQRLLDLLLPPAAAMSVTLRFPAGVEGVVIGEGAPIEVRAPSHRPFETTVRPGRDGRLRIGFAPKAQGTDDGPAILDARENALHTIGDGLVHSRVILHADVFRTPVSTLTLRVPPDFAVRSLEGKGVTGFRRAEGSDTVAVDLAKAFRGTITMVVEGERPYTPGAGVPVPRVTLPGAVRHRGEANLRFGSDVRVRAVTVTGGRRLPASRAKGQADLLRYAYTGEDSSLSVDLEAGEVLTDAASTYYLNLAEAGKTLIVTTTYRVLEGTVFTLRPKMPGAFELRSLSVNGSTTGFTRDLRADGLLEIALARGVPAGHEISLAATLEQSEADWVRDGEPVPVAFAVPSAGASREEGLVGIGADAAFRVLEAALSDLVPVGAADLTARGISATGLVYGYRIDGEQPGVTLEVKRHEPSLEARVITTLQPSPRRLEILAVVSHRIRNAGVRTLAIDVPAWAEKDQVRFDSPFVRGASMLEGEARPDDVPPGYERWIVDLNQRVIGRHATIVRYRLEQDQDDWRIEKARALGVRVPLERTERFLVVQRADGLEVDVDTSAEDVRSVELTDLPAEASVDPLRVLEVLRMSNGADGLALGVKKYDGAAVLDAIATDVYLETAVAREGILRSRAHVRLFNVDRQFLEAVLPPGSQLIGAVVGREVATPQGRQTTAREPVKVLANPDGVLLVPVPTARSRHERVLVWLTYETKLDGEIGGRVRVRAPVFPTLEVLQTVQRVAFDPDFEIEGVGGDYGAVSTPRRKAREPLLSALFGALSGSEGAAMLAPGSSARPDSGPASGVTGEDLRAGLDFNTSEPVIKDEEIAESAEELYEAEKPMDAAKAPAAPKPAAGPPVMEPPADMPAADPGSPPGGDGGAAAADEDGGGGEDGGERSRYQEGAPYQQGKDRFGRGRMRRKGLLSLDVPVLLGPRHVVARRLGGGGAMEIDLATREGTKDHYALIALAFGAIALLAGAGGVVRKLVVLGSGAALAGLLAALFGDAGGTLVVSLADALTLVALLWLAVGAVKLLIRLVARLSVRAPRPAGGAPAAVGLLLALLVGLPSQARADEPRPPVPVVKPPKRVFVPYDPADPTGMKANDRVFLPLETYLALFKAAHPESDPELVALGRMVSLVRAEYRLTVDRAEDEMATGEASYRFVKRGQGTMLVAWHLAGLAVQSATLDGEPVRLLLDKGVYRVAVSAEGDHTLALRFRAPLVSRPHGRFAAFHVEPFAGSRLDIDAKAFDGDVRVSGAGRVETAYQDAGGGTQDCTARAWLGRARRVTVALLERSPDELPTTVRTRVESESIHSVRDEGTETQVQATVYVLQGRAPFVDFALPAGVTVLDAEGPQVVRWESLASPSPRVRLFFAVPSTGAQKVTVRAFRAAAEPERTLDLPVLAALDTTGESGRSILNAHPTMRIDVLEHENLFRIGRPKGKQFAGLDGSGRVVGAWRFATRPTRLQIRTRRIEARMDVVTQARVVFGDDRVRTALHGRVTIEARAPVGTLVFDLPGPDEVRRVESGGLDTWWLEGEGADRRLFLRYRDLRRGTLGVGVQLERRLGGLRDGIAVPRWRLRGARRDRGHLFLYSLGDVDQKLGSVAGLRSLALAGLPVPPSGVEGAHAVQAYAWDAPVAESLPVGLRDPELESEAVVVSLVAPGDEEHRIEHLVLYEVRRGATDHLKLFVPDGGADAGRADVITTRDLREMRKERVSRKDADGIDIEGILYDIRLQSPRGGVIEVTVSQVWRARSSSGAAGGVDAVRPVRVVRPEGVSATHWFSLVRTFLDGSVDVGPRAGKPDEIAWGDLPLVPTGLQRSEVVRSYAARSPYTLGVLSTRHRLETQADAVVQVAKGTVVLGMDGWARVRMDYRVFNRSRQFLRFRLPAGATLFGATASGRPVKPMAGKEKTLLIAVPKVPLGETGYPVSLLFRVRAGADFARGGGLKLLLPEVVGVEVDRTVLRLFAPPGFDYDFESSMSRVEAADVAADLAEVTAREARDLLKLADTGTLGQRISATVNGVAILDRARAQLRRYAEGGKKSAAVLGQLDALGKQFEERRVKARSDWEVAQRGRQQAGPSNEEFASNARNIVQLDEVTNGLENDAVGDKNKAGWKVNPTAGGGKASKRGFEDLKQRIAGRFRARGASEARKNFQNLAQSEQETKDIEVARESLGQQEDTASFDYKQVAWLNDQLKKDQVRNRQLGAVETELLNRIALEQTIAGQPQGPTAVVIGRGQTIDVNGVQVDRNLYGLEDARSGGDIMLLERQLEGLGDESHGVGRRQRGTVAAPDDLFAGTTAHFGRNAEPGPVGTTRDTGIFYDDGADGSWAARAEAPGGLPRSAALNPSSGAYFNDGEDGDFRGGSENVFDNPMSAPATKVGLMGVDVELPQVGQVFYFRSLRAGAPIEIDVSSAEASVGGRVALLLAILLAVAFVVVGVKRRRALAAA